jgi:hypothetical protein
MTIYDIILKKATLFSLGNNLELKIMHIIKCPLHVRNFIDEMSHKEINTQLRNETDQSALVQKRST